MSRVLSSKWLVSAAFLLTAALGIATALYVVTTPDHQQRRYCALMPDAIGLYVGNPVTRLGVPIGTVRSITPENSSARVEFDVDSAVPVAAQTGAVTVSASLIAARQLALIDAPKASPALDAHACLTRTKTPQSLSRSLSTLGDAAQSLTTGGGPQQARQVQQSVATLAAATDGTGPDIAGIISSLATMLDNPGPGVADFGQTVDALSSLTQGMTSNWAPLKTLLTTTTGGLVNAITPMAATTQTLGEALIPIGSLLRDVISHYGHNLWPIMDTVIPLARVTSAGVRNFGDLLGIIPPLIDAFTISVDQRGQGLRVSYTPPSTRIEAKNPQLTCRNVNRIAPGQCRVLDSGHIDVDVISAVLRGTGVAR